MNLPGLGLEVTDDPAVGLVVNWQIDVGVGIDKSAGVYLLLDEDKNDDLHIDFTAEVDGGNLNAQLGFLELDVINNRTEVAAEIDIDLDPGSDGRIRLSEIFSTPLTTSFTGNVLEGGVDNNKAAIIDWTMTARINGNAALPQMRTGFDLGWTIDTFSDLGTAPDIEFTGVQMNLGSFLTDFLGPIVEKVNETLDPIRPVLDVLTEPIPVISDLGGQSRCWISLTSSAMATTTTSSTRCRTLLIWLASWTGFQAATTGSTLVRSQSTVRWRGRRADGGI